MDIRFSSFVLGMLGFLAFWTWSTSTDGFCSIKFIKQLADKEQTSCIEVIIFRYQTLFTGLLAVVAASITVMVYYFQLKEMKKQNNLTAKSSALGRYEAVLIRIKQLPNVDEIVTRSRRMIVHSATIQEGITATDLHMCGSIIWKLADRAGDIHTQLVEMRDAYMSGPLFINYINKTIEGCGRFLTAISNMQRAIINSHGKAEIADETAENLRIEFAAAADQLSEALVNMTNAYANEKSSLEELLIYLDRQITGQIPPDVM